MAGKLPYTTKVSNDPAATGVEHSFVLDASSDLYVRYFFTTLVTDANVASRIVHFQGQDASGNVLWEVVAGGSQAASLTRKYVGLPIDIAPQAVNDNEFLISIPREGLFVPAGGKIVTITTAKQATDDYGVLTAFCERAGA